jgi:hypothetical protein
VKAVLWIGVLQKHLQSGYDIVTFDFRGLGETRMAFTAASRTIQIPVNWIPIMVTPIALGRAGKPCLQPPLIGRPYFEMIRRRGCEAICDRFAQRQVSAVTSPDNRYTFRGCHRRSPAWHQNCARAGCEPRNVKDW